MSLPPIYESFRKSGIRFVTNSPDGKFKTNCPECKEPNTLFVELDADGLGFRCHCEGEGCGFSGFERLRPPRASGNGPSPRDDAAEKRRLEEARREFDAFEEARRELPEDDEPAPAPEPDPDPECEPEPEPASQAPTIDAAEGAPDGSHTHVWRAKEGDFPCTPTGQEHRDEKDGRVYAQVINSDGGLSIVPKDELFPKERDGAPQHKPPTIAEATALRRELVAAGYLPIPLFGKNPSLLNWSNITVVSDDMIVMWAKQWPDAVNTGVLTRNVPTLDLDILNEAAVRACEDLVRERCEEAGYILVRIGMPPKRAIPFRTEEPFDKITVNLIAPNAKPDAKPEKIEFLGNGQQVVVAGIHPDIKRPYRWHGGEPGEIKREDLPYTREAEARGLVDRLLKLLTRDFVYTTRARPGKSKPTGDGSDRGGGGPDDWQYLLENIREGRELHDSLRDLAAKMIRAGMGAGASVNLLRAHMEGSNAPHDERWQQRYDDIPRLVKGAVERLEAPPPKEPPPPKTQELPPPKPKPKPQPRPREKTPRKNSPFMPVMDRLNAVVGALIASERPPRDIDGVSTRLRKLSVPKMHAFDQTQANAGDDDDD